jgi:hypothetical protein
MSRKTTPNNKRLGNTRYVCDNYARDTQILNDIKYEAIQMRLQIAKMDKALERIIAFRFGIKPEPA